MFKRGRFTAPEAQETVSLGGGSSGSKKEITDDAHKNASRDYIRALKNSTSFQNVYSAPIRYWDPVASEPVVDKLTICAGPY